MDNDIYVMNEDGEIRSYGPRNNGWVITGSFVGVAIGAAGREELILRHKHKLERRLLDFEAEYGH